MTTAADIIKGALRSIQRLGVNETPTNEAYSNCLSQLNMMLDTLSARGLFIYATTQVDKTLTVGTNNYSIGESGDIDTTRPVKIDGVFIRDGDNYDYPVKQISEDKYRKIVSKETSARPQYLWYKPSYSLGRIYLYPTPDDSYSLFLDCISPFTSFSGITSPVSFPPGYQEALKYNLAVRLAPDYGVSISAEVAAMAASSMRTIENLNMNYRLSPVELEIPGVSYGTYNIWTDDYE